MYNLEFRITRDWGSSSSLVFSNPSWAKFPCGYVGLVFLNATLSMLLFPFLPMTVTYCHPTSVSSGRLWLMLVRRCEDAVRYTSSKGWWGCIFPWVGGHWAFKTGCNFELSLMDVEYRLSSSFTTFRGVLKVVRGIVHHISNSEVPDFSICVCVIGSWGELETRIGFLILWRFETRKRHHKFCTVFLFISLFLHHLPWCGFFFIIILRIYLFIFESGKMVLMLFFCIN